MPRRLAVRRTPPRPISDCSLLIVLDHEIETHPLLFQSFPHSFAKTPGVSSIAFLQLSNFALVDFLPYNSFRINTCGRSPRFGRNQPKSSARNSRRINTYKIPRCKFFRIRTYKKTEGGGILTSPRMLKDPSGCQRHSRVCSSSGFLHTGVPTSLPPVLLCFLPHRFSAHFHLGPHLLYDIARLIAHPAARRFGGPHGH